VASSSPPGQHWPGGERLAARLTQD